MSRTLTASAFGMSITVQANGMGLTVIPAEQMPVVRDALERDYEGYYATEELGRQATNLGTIPRGTYEHTVAALLALPGGFIVEDEQ